jgi:hypothetical protein
MDRRSRDGRKVPIAVTMISPTAAGVIKIQPLGVRPRGYCKAGGGVAI